jgi:hypothetical protein
VIVEGSTPPVLAMPVLCHVYQVPDALASAKTCVGVAALLVAQTRAAFLVDEMVTVPWAIAFMADAEVNPPVSAARVAVLPDDGSG